MSSETVWGPLQRHVNFRASFSISAEAVGAERDCTERANGRGMMASIPAVRPAVPCCLGLQLLSNMF